MSLQFKFDSDKDLERPAYSLNNTKNEKQPNKKDKKKDNKKVSTNQRGIFRKSPLPKNWKQTMSKDVQNSRTNKPKPLTKILEQGKRRSPIDLRLYGDRPKSYIDESWLPPLEKTNNSKINIFKKASNDEFDFGVSNTFKSQGSNMRKKGGKRKSRRKKKKRKRKTRRRKKGGEVDQCTMFTCPCPWNDGKCQDKRSGSPISYCMYAQEKYKKNNNNRWKKRATKAKCDWVSKMPTSKAVPVVKAKAVSCSRKPIECLTREQCKQGREHEYNTIFRKHQRKVGSYEEAIRLTNLHYNDVDEKYWEENCNTVKKINDHRYSLGGRKKKTRKRKRKKKKKTRRRRK